MTFNTSTPVTTLWSSNGYIISGLICHTPKNNIGCEESTHTNCTGLSKAEPITPTLGTTTLVFSGQLRRVEKPIQGYYPSQVHDSAT